MLRFPAISNPKLARFSKTSYSQQPCCDVYISIIVYLHPLDNFFKNCNLFGNIKKHAFQYEVRINGLTKNNNNKNLNVSGFQSRVKPVLLAGSSCQGFFQVLLYRVEHQLLSFLDHVWTKSDD